MTNQSTRRLGVAKLIAIVAALAAVIGLVSASTPTPAAAAPPDSTTLMVNVVDHDTSAAITEFEYIINIDDTGTTEQRNADPGSGCHPTDPQYPSSCNWTSIAGVPSGSSPVYTQGDQDDFGAGIDIPPGDYLISVNDPHNNYRLDGLHFTIPDPVVDPITNITVTMHPTPLPTSTIQSAVFEDISPTNGAPDLPVEHGLAGWEGFVFDYAGELSTDAFGNPLGTQYDTNGDPIPGSGGSVLSKCYVVFAGQDIGTVAPASPIAGVADPNVGRCPGTVTAGDLTQEGVVIPDGAVVEGKVKVENLTSNRFVLLVVPPDGANFIQTTSLEGNHDWDSWLIEGATGLDTEFVLGGEPFPFALSGWVPPNEAALGGTGSISGTVTHTKVYIPPKGGTTLPGDIWGGTQGLKLAGPIEDAWLSLNDLNNGDTAIWVGQANTDGTFTIPNVPEGTYTLSWWDEAQNFILDLTSIIVADGEAIDMGVLPLTGWYTNIDGYVFNDDNRNGKRDAGEEGLGGLEITMRKRENSLMDRGGALITTTDPDGYYTIENTYPMTQWLVMELYNDLLYTTGVTYQADNQPSETTVLGAGVDVSVMPIISLGGRIDWGLHAYDPSGQNGVDPRNGGIVGTVSYDTTRAERDPQYAGAEDWQPSIPGMTVNLYAPVPCGTNPGAPCDTESAQGFWEVDPGTGGYAKGDLINSVISEHWERPQNCTPRDVDGNPLVPGVDEQVMPQNGSLDNCLEGPLLGVQFDTGDPDHLTNPGVAVDGNYGFGDACFAPGVLVDGNGTLATDLAFDPSLGVDCQGGTFEELPANDYLVEVVSPEDQLKGEPIYTPTREEDINVNDGVDHIVPAVPPPSCAGDLHIVDVEGIGGDNHASAPPVDGVSAPASSPVFNPSFADAGGTFYEGQARRLCDTKLVTLNNGASIAPTFLFFTEVPLPSRGWGLLVDNGNFQTDPTQLLFGEKAGIPFGPVGVYDFTNRLVTTVESDYGGRFDVLLPSTNTINAASPAGVAASVYRFVGNDPGIPGRLNTNYKPNFRTISADFEMWPGLIVPVDLAPTQVGVQVQLPGGQFVTVSCPVPTGEPQLYAVSQPYVNDSGTFTIQGAGFGAQGPGSEVTLDGNPIQIDSWTDTDITATVNTTDPAGPQQLEITNDSGVTSSNGLTFHVLRGGGAGGPIEPAFPDSGILDDFNRANGGLNANVPNSPWDGDTSASNFRIQGTDYVEVRTSGRVYWEPEGPGLEGGGIFDADQEAFITLTKLSARTQAQQGLMLKFSGNSFGSTNNANGGAFIQVTYNTGTDAIEVKTKNRNQSIGNDGANLTTHLSIPAAGVFAEGDTLGARTLHDGTTIVYVNGVEVGRTDVLAGGWAQDLVEGAGSIGAYVTGINDNQPQNTTEFDDFGGGSVALNSTANLDDLPFPHNPPQLDDFERGNGNLGSDWAGDKSTSRYRIRSQGNVGGDLADVQVRRNGRIYWEPFGNLGGVFDSNQEAYFTFEELSTRANSQQGLLLKFSGNGFGGTGLNSGAWIEVAYSPSANDAPNDGEINVWVKPRDVSPAVVYDDAVALNIPGVTVAVGDTLGARTLSDGTTVVYLNGTEIGRVDVTDPGLDHFWPDDIAAHPGYIGTVFRGMGSSAAIARFDDFGGGSIREPLVAAGGGYSPDLYVVGPTGLASDPSYVPSNDLPTAANHAIQNALDDAAASPGDDLVVVLPDPAMKSGDLRLNPRGAYHENLIITKPVKLQGVGPGSPDGAVQGSIIDAGASGGDSPVFDDWLNRVENMTWVGSQTIHDGAGISLLAETENVFPDVVTVAQAPSIDGFQIRGGNQQGFPGNINQIGGTPTGQPANIQTQGGAIFSNGYTPNLRITNNLVENNGGSYGAIRIGTPDLTGALADNHNDNVVIAQNRIIGNAGTNLAGAIGLFKGADNYEVAGNDICGNYSAEYGGGVSHYGYSPGGEIHHNRITLNAALDEAGGVMIAGALPTNPTDVSEGAGSVSIHDNLIQSNLANDDGGGLRFLMAGTEPMSVFNNMIVNNVSTHEGGGVSLNDSTNVSIFNNTIMKNLTTATAITSTGIPAPAGLSTTSNSAPLQATLAPTDPTFSDPTLFNNIFWDNRAGTRELGTVTGLGLPGDVAAIDNWDMGVVDGSGLLSPVNSVIQQPASGATPDRSYNADASNTNADPMIAGAVDVSVDLQPWRNNPTFVGAILVGLDAPASGDYHLTAGSPAIDLGAGSVGGVAAPANDIDGDTRPLGGGIDAGADEQG